MLDALSGHHVHHRSKPLMLDALSGHRAHTTTLPQQQTHYTALTDTLHCLNKRHTTLP